LDIYRDGLPVREICIADFHDLSQNRRNGIWTLRHLTALFVSFGGVWSIGANTGREGRGVEDAPNRLLLPVGSHHAAGHVRHVAGSRAAVALPQSTQRRRRVCTDGLRGCRTGGRIRRAT